ncbi:MAG TPA: AAA family ATPase [Candidatus Limnocylindrales bacterium]|nr:AAA family ATPase [Candidatus Limnocylindrales bacterium]
MYSAFYGLKQEPFRLSPDPRFLHLAEPHRNTLRAMVEGVASRKGLQISVGPIGTGKTTLLYCLQHILLHEASPQRPLRTGFVVNPTLTVDELFEMLFDELEISAPASTKPARLRLLHELLLDSYRRNGAVVLIIDEAHLLSPALIEEVRLLLNLDNYPVNVLQVILCGQPELLPLLAKPELGALKQRISVISRLRALTFIETRAYIAERLHVAGLRGENPFTTPALEEIHRLTNGVPRLINSLCDRALTFGFRRQVKKLGADFIMDAADELSLSQLQLDVPEPTTKAPAVLSAASTGQKI